MISTLYVDSGYFFAGVVLERDRVINAAPIIKYMVGWTEAGVRGYANKRGWACGRVIEQVEPVAPKPLGLPSL